MLEMNGPCLLVPIIFFFSAACTEKLRETTTNASAGRIKVAVTISAHLANAGVKGGRIHLFRIMQFATEKSSFGTESSRTVF